LTVLVSADKFKVKAESCGSSVLIGTVAFNGFKNSSVSSP